MVVLVATGVTDGAAAMRRLGDVEHPGTPLVLVPMGGLSVAPGELPGVTTFRHVQAAVRALGRAAKYAAWRDQPRDRPGEPAAAQDRDRADRTRATADRLLGQTDDDGWLTTDDVVTLLTDYDLAPVGTVVTDPASAAEAAERVGFPVAVKVAEHAVVHKTDRGLVRVGLGSAEEVTAVVRRFEAELGQPGARVLVQPMAEGIEIALGLVRDPGFGPLVMVAAGGVATDVWNDRVFLLPPVTAGDAARAVRSLRVWPLLNGFRGSPAVDVAALEAMLVRLGQLAEDVPQVAEMDLNPVLVGPTGCALVDVTVRLVSATPIDAGVPRRLRRST